MVCGQGFDATDGTHNQLRHGSVVVVPARTVVLADSLRQFRVRYARPVELTLEDNQNGIAVAVDVLPCVRPVRHFDESSPEPM
jgi:hypothetical protein